MTDRFSKVGGAASAVVVILGIIILSAGLFWLAGGFAVKSNALENSRLEVRETENDDFFSSIGINNRVNNTDLLCVTAGETAEDSDGDGVIDTCDNCRDYYNPEQEDNDNDGVGNSCDFRSASRGGGNGDGDIECSSNSECGTDSFIGPSFCSLNNLVRQFVSHECLNPGLENSECRATLSDVLVEQCSAGCANGQCLPAVCTSDAQCGIDGFTGEPFCLGNDAYRNFMDVFCNAPGSSGASCGQNNFPQLLVQCQFACAQGACIRCDANIDCDDNNQGTSDVCLLPGTVISFCENTPIQCADECTDGSQQCNGNGFQICGNFDNDSCTEWSGVAQCGFGFSCQSGQCIQDPPSCSNECSSGSQQCSGNGFQSCGNFDDDSCLEWSGVSQCGSGFSCQSGQCVQNPPSCTNECINGAQQCNGNGFQICGNFDNDSCTEWSGVAQCGFGFSCSNGNCVQNPPSCADECTDGSQQCNGNGFQICGNFDNDSCTEWSGVAQCGFGFICQNGQCI